MRLPSFRARRLRAVVAVFAAGGVLAAAGLTALPAQAAVAAPRLRIVAGDRTVSAAWSAVAGATAYTVRIGTRKSLAHARTVTTKHRTARFSKLRNGRAYYVAVAAAVPGSIGATAVRSRVRKAVAAQGVPFPVTKVVATPGAAPDQVQVTWTGGGRARKVAVVAGSDVVTAQRHFHSAWYPATTRSITITVPARYRPYLGGGTGNPVYVKVVQSNSASTRFGPAYDSARKYRPSPVGTWSFARVLTTESPVTRLRVAALNVQSVGVTRTFQQVNRWDARAPRVARYINDAAPDLLMTAELTTGKLDETCHNSPGRGQPYRCRDTTQVADLARRLDGLRLAGTDTYDRVLDQMNSSPKWGSYVTNGAHVFYNPAKMTLLDHGYFSPAQPVGVHLGNVTGLGVSPWDLRGAVGADRWLSWAKLRTTEGRVFFAVAGHFPHGDHPAVVAARAQEARRLVAAITALAGDLPVVLGADLNGDPVRTPQAAQVTFMRDGWFDAGAVPAKRLRTNMTVSTTNGSAPQDPGVDPGYGSRPFRKPYPTSRIDFILLRNSPHTFSYANVLRLNADGTFVKSVQGTDHNMQLAEIGIAGPTS